MGRQGVQSAPKHEGRTGNGVIGAGKRSSGFGSGMAVSQSRSSQYILSHPIRRHLRPRWSTWRRDLDSQSVQRPYRTINQRAITATFSSSSPSSSSASSSSSSSSSLNHKRASAKTKHSTTAPPLYHFPPDFLPSFPEFPRQSSHLIHNTTHQQRQSLQSSLRPHHYLSPPSSFPDFPRQSSNLNRNQRIDYNRQKPLPPAAMDSILGSWALIGRLRPLSNPF